METLPSVIARAAVLMVATPLMFLLFIFNLIKSLIATDIFLQILQPKRHFLNRMRVL
nr:hypothetical protein [Streptococcus sp. oral taxon 064]